MPERVRAWRRFLRVAPADVRQLIEAQIRKAAGKHFGGYRSKPLLSLPPASTIKGRFKLGDVLYDKPRWPAGLRDGEVLQHIGIFGRSGSGKTNAAFYLLAQLAEKNIPVLFLDWKRNGRDLLPHLKNAKLFTPGRSLAPFPFNPFAVPPGVEPGVHTNHVVDLLADAYTLGEGSRSILQKALRASYDDDQTAADVQSLLAWIDTFPGKERVQNWKISATRAVESLSTVVPAASDRQHQDAVTSLLSGTTVLELDALPSNAKRFLIPLVCSWIYSLKLASARREKLDLVIFVEEAHNVLLNRSRQAHEPLMETLLRQAREVGIGFVLIDQQPSMMSAAALGNTFATLCMNQKDPRDVRRAADLSLVSDQDRRHLSKLLVGQAVLKLQDRWTEPVLVRVPHLQMNKGAISDAELRRKGAPLASRSTISLAAKAIPGRVPLVPVSDASLDEVMVALLLDVVSHPVDPVRTRYKRLGVGVRQGNAAKLRLLAHQLIEQALVPVGQTRKLVLRVTKKALKVLGEDSARSPTRESIAHEFWKQRYAQKFKTDGYRVQVEAPRKVGSLDVLAWNTTERVAIEIETGKSNVVHNVRQDLLLDVDRVVVVATDKLARSVVERQLARAGLLFPGRLSVVVAAEHDIE